VSDEPGQHSVAVWDRAWSRHERPPENHHEPLVDALERTLGGVTGRRLLEIGAGSARDSLRLAELGGRCLALDYSAAAVALARQGREHRGVALGVVRGDAFRLPFPDDSFEAVFSQGVMEHFADPRSFLADQLRVLAPGGLLLVDVPQTFNPYTVRKKRLMRAGRWFAGWETSYSLSGLERLLRSQGLEVVGSYGSGYFPAALLAVRNAHTFDQRHRLPVRLPEAARSQVEVGWRRLERQRWYYRWMWNIGVVARKR